MCPDLRHGSLQRQQKTLYWSMRLGIAFIWIWTAGVSWLAWPQAESIEWLRRLGVNWQTPQVFMAACISDLVLGLASCLYTSKLLWRLQFLLVVFYSLVIAVALPEFLFHPFGPISKNIAVLACLAWLIGAEER